MPKENQGLLTRTRRTAEQHKVMPAASIQPVPAVSGWHVIWPALLTSVLLWFSYFPLNWGWLGWVAMVPLLCLVRSRTRPRQIYVASWLGGLIFFLVALQWMRVADPLMYFTWIGLALACSAFVPSAILLVRSLEHRTQIPLILTFPAIWTALEFVRGHILGGFPWYFLAHTQHDFLPVIQITDLGGAYAVTFLVAAANALIFEWLCRANWFRRVFALPSDAGSLLRRSMIGQTVAIVILLVATVSYGAWRLGQSEFAHGPRLALIQGNLDQRIRNAAEDKKREARHTFVRHYAELNHEAVFQRPAPDLIVWPETSFLYDWVEVAPELARDKIPEEKAFMQQCCRDGFELVAELSPADILVGMNCQELAADGRTRRYNSAVLVGAGNGRFRGRYDKIHRVPFGEYVPFRDWLPWMNVFAPYDYEYSIEPGKEQSRFALGKYHFGVLICYEDTDPDLARQYVRPDAGRPQADFLVNISNDGWFNGTSEHEEHLAICRFRAIEARRAVARAVNMGISTVIDGNGRITALPRSTWSESKKISAVLTASIPLDTRTGLYARWGDWLPWLCCLVVGAGLCLPSRFLGRSGFPA
jgi:apolipoprotein N-acyltransferase